MSIDLKYVVEFVFTMYFSEREYNINYSESKEVGVIKKSDREGKKFMVYTPEGKKVHFGSSNHTIKVGKDQTAADSYCSRASAISGSKEAWTPANLSLKMWGCVGDKAHPSKALKIGDRIKY